MRRRTWRTNISTDFFSLHTQGEILLHGVDFWFFWSFALGKAIPMSSFPDAWHFGMTPYLWLMNPDPAFFVSDLQDAISFICRLLFEGTFTSFFTDKSHKNLQVEMKGFRTIYAWWSKDPDLSPDPYLWLTNPGGLKTYWSYGSGSGSWRLPVPQWNWSGVRISFQVASFLL